ncbi:MAG: UDP-N-acetylmuramate--alanine ligase [bacterium]
MNLNNVHSVFFIGIGGIGMSALARYFKSVGKPVFGYDKTKTSITDALENEGIQITFEDAVEWADTSLAGHDASTVLVVYTPAIPSTSKIKQHLLGLGYPVIKRSEALGIITKNTTNLSIAGTHGKTTTSCLLSHILTTAKIPHVAFLGGIATNYNSNYWNSLKANTSSISITEADEFDRSFLTLRPTYAGITNMDADHLDIYEKQENLTESFVDFGNLVHESGKLYVHIDGQHSFNRPITTYGIERGHISARNVHIHNQSFVFDLYLEDGVYRLLTLGIPGRHNVENAVVASVIATEIGVNENDLRTALSTFKGVKRRFEYILKEDDVVYIDDYAHHPTELDAIISSTKQLYPDAEITGIFQPHLYSRTRDFMPEFAASLSALDEVILMDIYPARELPIDGITSNTLLGLITTKKSLLDSTSILEKVSSTRPQVLLSLGAGDIDKLVQPLKETLQPK